MKRRDGSVVQAIKARLNLVEVARRYVELRHTGGPRWMAPCPFHQETKPSFSINEEEGFFYCFGCQASGDIFDFYGRIHGLEFRETLEALAEEAGVSLEDDWKPDPKVQREQSFKRQCLRMYDVAREHFRRNLTIPAGQECRDYIARRQLSPEIVNGFELGWSLREWSALADALRRGGFQQADAAQAGLLSRNDAGRMFDRFRGRMIFPIKNLAGQVIAFGGRIIADEDQAKYINSSDSAIYKKGEHLYGLFQARRAMTQHKTAMLTEGYMDVLTLHQYGYNMACGVLGTALTPEQVKRLGGFCSTVELLFDGDNPGRKAAMRACEMLLTRGMRCKVVLLPDGEDIDSLLHDQGKDAFEALRKSAPDGLDFCIDTLRTLYSPGDALEWSRNLLRQAGAGHADGQLLASRFLSRIASGLGIREEAIREGLSGDFYKGAAAAAPGAREARNPAPQRQVDAVHTSGDAPAKRDRAVMFFLVRYPHHFARLREAGAELVLASPWARELWAKMARHGAEPEQLLPNLSEREKEFWIRCRTGDVPPRDKELEELQDLLSGIESVTTRELGTSSMMAALRQTATSTDPAAGIELLRALQETLGRSNG
ncbi:DNA primase [Nitratidesulfovibrio sp. SRB-5]|uniref:DNA primase n=1 Tax=Nitratidesulfovibrio sp. SRB-5 TaxID=2872636 RepID=UPI0010264DF3|nr:DNA primase [Nitratidesulfovibrio sp. SRB-5]MBZ2171883.1 DNA primase [Nitratidesulfovibrio sp. SRB-5]RXF77507.1 DNA primase [Desulfovibrio sp. DS-1]